MKTIPSAEQREFAAALRALLAAENPVSLVRALDEPGTDRRTPSLWKAVADSGVFGLAVAEEYGGAGGSLDDLAVFFTEAGRALCPTTVHSTVHAALAVDQLGSRRPRPLGCPRSRAAASAPPPPSGTPATPRSSPLRCAPIPIRIGGGSTEPRITSPTPTSPISSWSRPPRRGTEPNARWSSSSTRTAPV
ncbi:acyl-CoA dehydrogenase, N-terminal domain protein [Mycobacterium intracellulare]|nr:acyl-CoA dehydrogenase, N-terminal domain protein [Mycobacterium intracellulare]